VKTLRASLETAFRTDYGSVVAKRLHVSFRGDVGASRVDEGGQPKPCASGVGWVNAHTLETLEKRNIPRTDPWGRPLAPEPEKIEKK
jgi:hypothetical protein